MPDQKRLSVALSKCRLLLQRASYVRALIFSALVLYAAFLSGVFSPHVVVSLKMGSNISHFGEIFFATSSDPYSEREKQRFIVTPDGTVREYLITLDGTAISKIRIDPGSGTGAVQILNVQVRDNSGHFDVPLTALKDSKVSRHIDNLSISTQGLSFNSTGYDPFIGTDLPRDFGPIGAVSAVTRASSILLLSFIAWLLVERGLKWFSALATRHRLASSSVQHFNSVFGDRDVLLFTPAILLSFTALLAAALLYISLGLNQSSIGVWEGIYPYQPVDQAIDLGSAKGVRSDEWRVQTPWILNQVQRGSPVTNPNVGGASSPLIASLPVEGLVGLPHLKFMGFRFLDLEHGFSWFWAYKTFVTLGASLWLLLLLTRGNLFVSGLGATWIYGSSYVQWWFSSNLPEILSAFTIGVIGAIYLFFSSNRLMIAVGAFLCVYSGCNVLLNLYPPFVVPLFYLAFALLLGYALRHRQLPHVSSRFAFRVTSVGMVFFCIAAYVLYLYPQVQDSIDVMRGTLYPGQRISESGGVPLRKLLSGYFEAFRLSESDLPFAPNNASEAASFVWIFPFAILAFGPRSWLRRDLVFVLPLCFFLLLCATWIRFDLGGPLEQLLQTIGWSMVTPKRAIFALGVGSILLVCMLLAAAQQSPVLLTSLRTRCSLAFVALIFLTILGYRYHRLDPQFFTTARISIGVVAGSLVIFGMLVGRRAPMVMGVAAFLIPALMANPLVSGTSALTQKPVLVAATNISSRSSDPRWMVIGDVAFTQGLKAVGLDVLAGSQYLPDSQWISVLDPGRRYESVWNRYATVHIKSKPGAKHAVFRKIRADQYQVELDVCSVDVAKLGITHVAYTTEVAADDYSCLSELPSPVNSEVRLFRLSRGDQ